MIVSLEVSCTVQWRVNKARFRFCLLFGLISWTTCISAASWPTQSCCRKKWGCPTRERRFALMINSTLFKRFHHSTVCFEETPNVTECSTPAAEPNQCHIVRTTQSSGGEEGFLLLSHWFLSFFNGAAWVTSAPQQTLDCAGENLKYAKGSTLLSVNA